MRDWIKDEEYFAKYIFDEHRRIKKCEERLKANTVAERRINAVKCVINAMKKNILFAEYSRGAEVKSLRDDFIKWYDEFVMYFADDLFILEIYDTMSLAILFDIGKERFQKMVQAAEKQHRVDALVKWYSNYMLNNEIGKIGDDFIYGKPYTYLADVINDRENSVENLETYLRKYWYRGHRKETWYNVHKTDLDGYNGYWSFEAGAIAKILNLDDECLKGAKYYPYDLAHFKADDCK